MIAKTARYGNITRTGAVIMTNIVRYMMMKNAIDAFAAKYQVPPYELLAMGIISRAVDDYREAYNREYYWYCHKQSQYSRINCPQYVNTKEIEEFIFSKWFQVLTALDPDYLHETLVKDIKDTHRKHAEVRRYG